MRAVDTNVLVRLLARDDAGHAGLRRPSWRAKAVEMLLNHRQLTVQDPDVVERALGHFRKRPSLCFSDCPVVEAARKAGHGPVGTFDRDLARLDGAELLRERPVAR